MSPDGSRVKPLSGRNGTVADRDIGPLAGGVMARLETDAASCEARTMTERLRKCEPDNIPSRAMLDHGATCAVVQCVLTDSTSSRFR